ncbi:serine/threonine protein kinase [Colletotrichum limetticola]|uniref:Serine/threonine protein kinase n=1 Tax=Colletotrichum limetticola TaxID=1209924 RepID=A0ABQ9PFH6_9PEZI|nr:serine/threonine protein kinase [Colletotrichum limetticola]
MFLICERLRDLKSRSQACELCAILVRSAEMLGIEDGGELKCRREGSSLKIDPDGPTILSLYVSPGKHRVQLRSHYAQIGFPTLPGTGSPEQYVLLNEWLRVCDEQHSHGVDDRTELPTRVLDVGTDPNSTIHLCEGKFLPLERYTALSHCWGVNSQAQVRTLKENIDVFRKRIDFGILPKSFQDAVKITRALGLRYLWIDSLCIIQNDKQDWAFEATRMEHVFSSAYVTIAATAASSSAEGFLRQKAKHPFVTLEGPDSGFTFVRKSIDDFHQDVEQAVLNQRGWVLQERALSRRTLHFTASQVYWECGKGVHCETLMKLSNRQAALLGDSDFPKSALEYFKGGRIMTFQTLYQMYSRLAFTVPSDRSIGIKGLEERLVKDFVTKGGFGIFDEYLQRSLLWQKALDASLDRISYPPGRRVPSWSWMAYQGPIAYLEAPFEHINWTKDIVTPFNTDSGKKTHWEVSEGSEIPLLRGVASRISLDAIELLKRVRFDESKLHTIDQLRCIVIGKEKTEGLTREPEHYVLVIVRLSGEQGGRYERVGVGRLLAEHILLREPQLNVEVQ